MSGIRTHRSSALAEDPGTMGLIARFWKRSYGADYVGLAILITTYLLIVLLVEPFHRMFSLDDLSLQYPHAKVERVSVFFNIFYAAVIPFICVVLWAVFFRPPFQKAHVTLLGLVISAFLTSVITDIIKNAVGRPRPDLIDRCKPKKGTPTHVLVTIFVCTEKSHHTLHDGWRSFPSGHSSLAFGGLGFFAMFLAGQMHVFRPGADLVRVIVAIVPLICAALIAISRLEDYRHDVYDVLSGSALGFTVAYISYYRYYPSLRSQSCDTPYATWQDSGSTTRKDDEERSADRRSPEWNGNDARDSYEERLPLHETGAGVG